jgi:uncharacterized protein (UPF0276 family)
VPRPAAAPIPAAAGIGLRFQHHRALLEERPRVGWLEVHAENYMGGGPSPATLDRIRRDHPLSLHGVGLSLGSAQGLCADHLARLSAMMDRYEPGLVSDHLSWSVVDGEYLADLLPLPLTEEALDTVCRNTDHAQHALGRRLLVENPSSYLRYADSEIPEWEFLAELSRRTGCGILCDVNNIYVSCSNHGWSAADYLAALPVLAVAELHLAGHAVREFPDGSTLRIDDHGAQVSSAVWDLYRQAIDRFGVKPTLIEWDTRVPDLAILLAEAAKAQAILDQALQGAHHGIAA